MLKNILKRTFFAAALLTIIAAAGTSAYATHFRYGTVSNQPVLDGNNQPTGSVQFTLTLAYRRNTGFYSSPTTTAVLPTSALIVGAQFRILQTTEGFFFRSPNTTDQIDPIFTITSVDTVTDSLVATATFIKNYNGLGYTVSPNTAILAYWGGCCRLSNLLNGANDLDYRVETIVRPWSTNKAPTVSLPPIITVPKGQFSFFIPATDIDGDTVRYRFTNCASNFGQIGENGLCTGINGTNRGILPHGNLANNPSINSSSGLFSWNSLPGTIPIGLYATQIVVEDLDANNQVKSKTMVDVLINLINPVAGQPPLLKIDGLLNPAQFTVVAGNPLSFTVSGEDPDLNPATQLPNLPVTLTAANLPVGATMNPALSPLTGPSGISSLFTWIPTPMQGGSYVLNFTATDGTQLQDSNSVTILVKVNQTITFGALGNKTFGDADFPVAASSSSNLPVAFAASGNCSIAGNMVQITGAGSCSITASQPGNGTYLPAPDVTQTFNINKAQAIISLGNLNQTYTGAPLSATAATSPANLTGVSISYDGSPTAPTNAGSYNVVASLTSDNYQADDAVGMLVIAKAAPIVTATGNTCVYSGSPCAGNGAATGVDGSDLGAVTLAYSPGGSAPTGGGSYTVIASIGETTNHVAGSSQPAAITINQADQTISFAALSNKTYGDADFPVSASATSGLPVSFSASGSCTISGSTVHITGAGSCTITAAQPGDANYNAAEDAQQAFSIGKATPAIIWSDPADIFYGTALSNAQLNAASSFQNAPVDGAFVYNPAAGGVLNAGAGQTLSVEFTPADTANFNSAAASVQINVLKAALVVTAENKSKTYGDAAVPFTVTYSGFVNGDDEADLGGALAFNFVDAATTLVGVHPITPSGLTSSNYAVSFAGGTLTVGAAQLIVTPANKSRLYGSANPALDGMVAGLQNADDITASYATTADAASSVGNYAITVALSDPDGKLPNYAVTLNTGQLSVTPAPLSIAADNKSRLYGAANPLLTGTVNGVLNNDGIDATYATTANAASPVGGYAITVTTVDPNNRLSNYDLTIDEGTLTVDPAALTVSTDNKSRQYGLGNPTLTGNVSGAQNNEAFDVSYATPATAASDAGDYQIVPQASGATLSNYTVTYVNGTLTVTKAPQMIAWANPADIVFGTPLGAAQLNASVSVIGPAPAGAVSYAPPADTVLNPGAGQALTVNVAETNNYEAAAKTVFINVGKMPTSITVSGPAFIAQGGSVTLSGVLTDANNNPLGSRSVTFSIGSGAGVQNCTGMTNAGGLATCAIAGVNQPLGPNLAVGSSFAGDANYHPSAGSATALVFAYAAGTGGAFVVGDGNSTVGQAVTFWGSQWSQKNSLSGGAAPNSFKGFANRSSTTPASCGATWMTDPGSSSNPPATVPAYMAVIVTGSVAKNGSTLSGNTTKMVIVKTNAGYGPSAGNTGTGTVVGVICQ